MMTFFPVPYEDELLYSILGRYHIRSGNISIKATLQDVFGKTSVTAVVDLPSHINRIIDNMPVGNQYTADYLVDKHTLYSFYSVFLPPENALKIKQYMKGDKGGSIYNKIGLMASSVSLNQYFKFCPQCIKEDMEKYGELYWHRAHQIPGVLVCPKHKIPLYDSQVPVRGFNKHEYITASSDNCKISNEKTNYPDEILEKMIILARDIDFLLNNIFANKTLEWFRDQYLNRLKEFKEIWSNLSVQLREIDLDYISVIEAKKKAENAMYNGVCRTERIAAIDKGDFINDESARLPISVTEKDIISYVEADKLLNNIGVNNYVPVDYVKSSPYILSFMRDYKMKRQIERYFKNKRDKMKIARSNNLWINEGAIRNYREISSANGRLERLKEAAFENKAEMLLWIPPSLPYYEPLGPFKNEKETKKQVTV
jgi:hypothetical protein